MAETDAWLHGEVTKLMLDGDESIVGQGSECSIVGTESIVHPVVFTHQGVVDTKHLFRAVARVPSHRDLAVFRIGTVVNHFHFTARATSGLGGIDGPTVFNRKGEAAIDQT